MDSRGPCGHESMIAGWSFKARTALRRLEGVAADGKGDLEPGMKLLRELSRELTEQLDEASLDCDETWVPPAVGA